MLKRLAFAGGLLFCLASPWSPGAYAVDDPVESQLRSSGFSDAMIRKIMNRDAASAKQRKEPIAPLEKPAHTRARSMDDSLTDPILLAEAGGATATDAGSPARIPKPKEEKAPSDRPTRDRNGKVLTIEELYGGNLYSEDDREVKKIVAREERVYYPGVLGQSIRGLSGLSQMIIAHTLKKGEFLFGAHMVYNTINRQNGTKVSFLAGEYANQFSFPITASAGVLDNLELGFVFPVENWKINSSSLRPSNDSASGIGDVRMRMKYKLPLQPESDSALAVGWGAKFPTADKKNMFVNGATGEADYEVFGSLSQKLSRANFHTTIGYTFTGDPKSTKANERLFVDDKFNYDIGVDFSKTDDMTLAFELNGENWGALGSKLEFTPSIRSRVKSDLVVDAALPISFFNDQEYGYNFKFIMGASYVF